MGVILVKKDTNFKQIKVRKGVKLDEYQQKFTKFCAKALYCKPESERHAIALARARTDHIKNVWYITHPRHFMVCFAINS